MIKYPGTIEMNKKLQILHNQIVELECCDNLCEDNLLKLKELKKIHAVKTHINIQHIMFKEEKNPIDIVITNPYHFAVALNYKNENNEVVCVAKGSDQSALVIMLSALNSDIDVIEYPTVARTLYAEYDINEVIANTMYEEIAKAIKLNKQLSKEHVEKSLEERLWEK